MRLRVSLTVGEGKWCRLFFFYFILLIQVVTINILLVSDNSSVWLLDWMAKKEFFEETVVGEVVC